MGTVYHPTVPEAGVIPALAPLSICSPFFTPGGRDPMILDHEAMGSGSPPSVCGSSSSPSAPGFLLRQWEWCWGSADSVIAQRRGSN